MLRINKAFEIMDEFDDPTNKVLHEDMKTARAMIWTNGLAKAIPFLRNSIHPYHYNAKEAFCQIDYMMEFTAA